MDISYIENLPIKGHLNISKVYRNGVTEEVFNDKNVIVSGFGWSLGWLYSKLGSLKITDYQIDRFQLGVSGHSAIQLSSTYQLSSPLTSISEYVGTGDSNLFVFSAAQYKNGTASVSPTPFFGSIPFNKVTRIDERSVRYTIYIDEDSCNNLTRSSADVYLNEIGLFIKNPRSQSPEASVLGAYKYFSNIRKTSDFGLLFKWTITFG